MPAGTGTLSLTQVINFQSLPALGISSGIPVTFPTGASSTNNVQLGAGSGAGKYNVAYASTANYGTGGTALNLTNTLVQPDGTVATFADVLVICLYAPIANTDYISVGAGTDPLAWLTTAIKIYPGMTLNMLFPVATGLAVTTTTGDRINIVANAGTQSLTVLLAGH